jgi:hypothetical protein
MLFEEPFQLDTIYGMEYLDSCWIWRPKTELVLFLWITFLKNSLKELKLLIK